MAGTGKQELVHRGCGVVLGEGGRGQSYELEKGTVAPILHLEVQPVGRAWHLFK